jgi:hypothetical protein
MHLVAVVGIPVYMVQATDVETAGPADDAVDFVAFGQKKFGQIGAILAGDAGNQCFLHELFPLMMVQKRNGTLICMIWIDPVLIENIHW